MVAILSEYKCIYPSQHVFVKGRLCLTNFICFKGVTKYADERSAVDIIHLEFKKAVDKVPHQRQVKIP